MKYRTPIFRNLDYQTSWFGLTFDDMPFILAPIGLAILAMMFFGLPPAIVVVVAVGTLVGLATIKYGKPQGYLWLVLEALLMPRHLSHKARDQQLDPMSTLPARRPSSESRKDGPT